MHASARRPKAHTRRVIVELLDFVEKMEGEEMLIPNGMYPLALTSAQVFNDNKLWGNRFPTPTLFEWFTEIFGHKFKEKH